MNDARIQELVRMALEVDELEGAAPARAFTHGAGAGHGSGRGPVLRRLAWAGAGLAAAAAVAMMVVTGPWRPVGGPGGGAPGSASLAGIGDGSVVGGADAAPVAHAPGSAPEGRGTKIAAWPGAKSVEREAGPHEAGPTVVARRYNLGSMLDPDGLEQCVVMAIYRDPLGAMHCVQMKPHEWQENRCLPEVPEHELRSVRFKSPCADPATTLVVALAGPRRSLPKTEESALALARCILGASGSCETHEPCIERAAFGCVAPEVSVRVETVASRGN